MPNPSIQDKLLDITVTGCNNLMRTEWLGRQDPYVCLEYGPQNCRTRVCKDGDKNPTFHDKFTIKLIEGIREVNVNVWNKNVVSRNCFIASGKIQLARVLSEGHDDRPWPLLSQTNRSAGDVNVIMHYDILKKSKEKEETQHPWQAWQFGRPLSPPPPPNPTFNRSYSTPLPYSYYCYTCGINIYGSSDYYYHQYHQLQAYTPPPPPFYPEQPGPSQPYPPYGPYPPPSSSHHYWR